MEIKTDAWAVFQYWVTAKTFSIYRDKNTKDIKRKKNKVLQTQRYLYNVRCVTKLFRVTYILTTVNRQSNSTATELSTTWQQTAHMNPVWSYNSPRTLIVTYLNSKHFKIKTLEKVLNLKKSYKPTGLSFYFTQSLGQPKIIF